MDGGFEAGGFEAGGFEAGGFEVGGLGLGGFELGGFKFGGFKVGGFEFGGFPFGGFDVGGFDVGGVGFAVIGARAAPVFRLPPCSEAMTVIAVAAAAAPAMMSMVRSRCLFTITAGATIGWDAITAVTLLVSAARLVDCPGPSAREVSPFNVMICTLPLTHETKPDPSLVRRTVADVSVREPEATVTRKSPVRTARLEPGAVSNVTLPRFS